MTCGKPSTDHPDDISALRMNDDEQAAAIGETHEDETILLMGVVGIEDGDRERIPEGGRRLVEGDSMLP